MRFAKSRESSISNLSDTARTPITPLTPKTPTGLKVPTSGAEMSDSSQNNQVGPLQAGAGVLKKTFSDLNGETSHNHRVSFFEEQVESPTVETHNTTMTKAEISPPSCFVNEKSSTASEASSEAKRLNGDEEDEDEDEEEEEDTLSPVPYQPSYIRPTKLVDACEDEGSIFEVENVGLGIANNAKDTIDNGSRGI